MNKEIKERAMAYALIVILIIPFVIISRYLESSSTLDKSMMLGIVIGILIVVLFWARKKEKVIEDERSELLDHWAMRNGFIFYTLGLPYLIAFYILNENAFEQNGIIVLTSFFALSWVIYFISRIYYNYTH